MGQRPPFTIRQILNLCWGLTLLYSHDDKQIRVANQLMNMPSDPKADLHKIFASYMTNAIGSTDSRSNNNNNSSGNDESEHDEEESNKSLRSIEKKHITEDNTKKSTSENTIIEKQFTENVMMAMIKTLRNLGLARDANVSSLMYQVKHYANESNYLQDVSSFSSASKESIVTKILPFLGGGSALTLGITASSTDPGASPETLIPGTLPSLNDLLSTQTLPFGLTTQTTIFLFIASGIGVLTLVTFILKARKNKLLHKMENELKDKAQDDWEKKIRPSMVECLFQLYKDLRSIKEEFYPNHEDDKLASLNDTEARKVIEEEIIVPKSVQPSSRFIISKKEIEKYIGGNSNNGRNGGSDANDESDQ